MNDADLAPLLDYTALAPDVSAERVQRMCEQARAHRFATVCVNPIHVARAAAALEGAETRVCTVVGYPLGGLTTRQKVYESATALEDGALEIDMVLNVALLQSGDETAIRTDILSVADAVARNPHALLKVVVETTWLDEAQTRAAVRYAVEGGAHFIAVANPLSPASTSLADIALCRAAAGALIGVKAGGVQSARQARDIVAAGANRLGSEDALALVSGTLQGS